MEAEKAAGYSVTVPDSRKGQKGTLWRPVQYSWGLAKPCHSVGATSSPLSPSTAIKCRDLARIEGKELYKLRTAALTRLRLPPVQWVVVGAGVASEK